MHSSKFLLETQKDQTSCTVYVTQEAGLELTTENILVLMLWVVFLQMLLVRLFSALGLLAQVAHFLGELVYCFLKLVS